MQQSFRRLRTSSLAEMSQLYLVQSTTLVTKTFSRAGTVTLEAVSTTRTFYSDNADAPAEYISTPPSLSPPTTLSTSPRPVKASKHLSKALRQGTESIRAHPTDPSKVIVTYHVTVDGRHYDQETEIPEVVSAPANGSYGGGSVIFPDVEASKVPRTSKNFPWTVVPGSSVC